MTEAHDVKTLAYGCTGDQDNLSKICVACSTVLYSIPSRVYVDVYAGKRWRSCREARMASYATIQTWSSFDETGVTARPRAALN